MMPGDVKTTCIDDAERRTEDHTAAGFGMNTLRATKQISQQHIQRRADAQIFRLAYFNPVG
ncbi:hypothetical protein D3C83_311900 [compost metagenome]